MKQKKRKMKPKHETITKKQKQNRKPSMENDIKKMTITIQGVDLRQCQLRNFTSECQRHA